VYFIIDEEHGDVKKHPHAMLYPSEVVTLMAMFAAKVVSIVPFIVGFSLIIESSFRMHHITRACCVYFVHMRIFVNVF